MSVNQAEHAASAPTPKRNIYTIDGDVLIQHTNGDTFLVDSRALSRCSPVFRAMFLRWQEGQNLSSTNPAIIQTNVNIPGLDLLLRIMHNVVGVRASELLKVTNIITNLIIAADYYNALPVTFSILESLLYDIHFHHIRGLYQTIPPSNRASCLIAAYVTRNQKLLTICTLRAAESFYYQHLRSTISASESLIPSQFWCMSKALEQVSTRALLTDILDDLCNAIYRMRNTFIDLLVNLKLSVYHLERLLKNIESYGCKASGSPCSQHPETKALTVSAIYRKSWPIGLMIAGIRDYLKTGKDLYGSVDDKAIREFLDSRSWQDWGLCLACLVSPVGYTHVCPLSAPAAPGAPAAPRITGSQRLEFSLQKA